MGARQEIAVTVTYPSDEAAFTFLLIFCSRDDPDGSSHVIDNDKSFQRLGLHSLLQRQAVARFILRRDEPSDGTHGQAP